MDAKCDLCSVDINLFEWASFLLHTAVFISQVFAVQHVDVCMFSNGKFKNVVADVYESYQIKAGESYRKEYTLLPVKGKRKNENKTKPTRKLYEL